LCALLIAVCAIARAPSAARAATIAPAALSERAAALIDQTAVEWTAHELSDGQLLDPVLGTGAGSYGEGMTGGAMVAAGLSSSPGAALVEDGLNAEQYEVGHPDGGGFELLSLAEDYVWNRAHLTDDSPSQAAQLQLAAFLSAHGPLVSGAGVCYTTTNCYDNLKLVAAVAELALLRTGLGGTGPGALLDGPHTLRLAALSKLAAAASNTGSDAMRSGTVEFSGAGILSDPAQNPLAYHALSTLMLGHAVVALGANTPPLVGAAFSRAARALVGLIAPDGDVAYIGRGQGQVWTVAATVDALSLAAAQTTDTVWRGRYLAGAQLALRRLETVYPRDGWGLPVVPRLGDFQGTPNYRGVDGYANAVEYNGLTLWALRDAATALAGIPPTPAQSVPSQTQGVFLDPSHARFATVTHGRLWFAVHGTDSNLSDDRYGFGLVSAELYTGERWDAVLPFRPLTYRAQVGGIAMRSDGRTRYPIGQLISASSDGTLRISGRWAPSAGLAGARALWIYRPASHGNGVVLQFHARANAAFQFEVWFPEGSLVRVRRDGLRVREPDGTVQTYTVNAAVKVRAAGIAHSAYAENLAGAIITLPAARRPREILYTTAL
jgi:hypothetical protein